MIIGSNDAEFGYPLKFSTIFNRQRDLTLGVFLEAFACQKWAFLCKCLPLSTFSRSSVTRIRWPEKVRSFRWKRDEHQLNGVVDIQLFSVFQGDKFSTWKMETKLSPAYIFFCGNSSTLITIRKQFSNWLNSFRENLPYVFFTQPGKAEKGRKILGKK